MAGHADLEPAAPSDAITQSSWATDEYNQIQNGNQPRPITPASQTDDGTPIPTQADVVGGVDYSSVTISPQLGSGVCGPWKTTTQHDAVGWTTVGEAHAYWDALGRVSQVGVGDRVSLGL